MEAFMRRKAFVLLSGGLDSTTCLYQAIHDFVPPIEGVSRETTIREAMETRSVDWVEAISVDYGQRHSKEMGYAARTCWSLGIPHTVLAIGDILSGVMLTDASINIPDVTYDEIKGVSPTYVPFRNGTLLSLIAAHAQKYANNEISQEAKRIYDNMETTHEGDITFQDAMNAATNEARDLCGIYFGAHAEDAANWAYPDCTPEFIGAMGNAIYTGTYYAVRLYTPLMWSSKADVVRLGARLGVPFKNTWSCYKGEALHCGACPTCYARQNAFKAAGVEDPTEYASRRVE